MAKYIKSIELSGIFSFINILTETTIETTTIESNQNKYRTTSNDIQLLTSYFTNENILKIINELNKLTNEN